MIHPNNSYWLTCKSFWVRHWKVLDIDLGGNASKRKQPWSRCSGMCECLFSRAVIWSVYVEFAEWCSWHILLLLQVDLPLGTRLVPDLLAHVVLLQLLAQFRCNTSTLSYPSSTWRNTLQSQLTRNLVQGTGVRPGVVIWEIFHRKHLFWHMFVDILQVWAENLNLKTEQHF